MKIAHLTTVDMSLRYLLLPQLDEALAHGESIGISAPGEHVEFLEARGIRHIPLTASTRGMSLLADLRAARQLWRVLRRERVDILHTHNPKPGVYGRIVGRLAGVPVVVNTVHGLYATSDSSLLKRVIVYTLEWIAARFSDMELVQNPEDVETLRRLRIVPERRLRLLGNGVNLDRFGPDAAARVAARAEWGVDDDTVVVGMVGRLVAEKGVPELIEAAERLGDGYAVVVVGPDDPEKADALPRETIVRGEAAGVRFLGMRDDVHELYGGFDVFVLPSHREGFPRAAMEAAASGLPVIATDIRGCRQVVEPGVNGLLFPVGDVEALVGAVRSLDAPTREHMATASVERARIEFDEQRVVERVFDAYRDVATRRGLVWAPRRRSEPVIRRARPEEAAVVARLHQEMIDTGFLSSLGHGFLTVLYRAMIRDDQEEVIVAEVDGAVVGFVAGTPDTSGFYRRFIKQNLLPAGVRMVPAMVRPSAFRRILETLRHGSDDAAAGPELLSLAVAPTMRGRGVAGGLCDALFTWAISRGLTTMSVVVGAGNEVAISVYERCGFVRHRSFELHAGEESLELQWSA